MRADPYVSRTGDDWAMVQRRDPVVWERGAAGPLSAEQLEQFAERGYLVLRGLLSAVEVAALRAEAARMRESADRASDEVIAEPGVAGGEAVRSIFRVHKRNSAFRELADDDRLRGAARQILGSDVYIHQSRINFKPGFDGRPFQWHSDFETWHIEDGMPAMRAVSASVLLTANTEHNGPLMIIPGSHRLYVRCVGETPPDHYKQSLRVQEYGVPPRDALAQMVGRLGIESATGDAGTVVLFDCNAMHGSAGNITPMPRNNVFLVYNSVHNRLVEPFGGRPPRPGFLGERD